MERDWSMMVTLSRIQRLLFSSLALYQRQGTILFKEEDFFLLVFSYFFGALYYFCYDQGIRRRGLDISWFYITSITYWKWDAAPVLTRRHLTTMYVLPRIIVVAATHRCRHTVNVCTSYFPTTRYRWIFPPHLKLPLSRLTTFSTVRFKVLWFAMIVWTVSWASAYGLKWLKGF